MDKQPGQKTPSLLVARGSEEEGTNGHSQHVGAGTKEGPGGRVEISAKTQVPKMKRKETLTHQKLLKR